MKKPSTRAVKLAVSPINIRLGNRLGEKVGLVLVSGFLYSVAIASVGVAANYIPPVTFTALRLGTAAVIWCGILLFLRPSYRWSVRGAGDVAVVGLLNIGIPFICLAMAVAYISSSLAAVLFNILPVLTIVFAHFLLADEKLTPIKAAGTVAAVAGATILLVRNETGLAVEHSQGWIGQLLIFAASLSGALGMVFTRSRLRQENPIVLSSGQVFACLVVFIPLAIAAEGLPSLGSYAWQGYVATAIAAVSAPVAAYLLLFYLVKKYSASLGGFSGIATPLFSVIIGVLLLGEVITLPIAVGALLLLAGVWSLHYF
jgi:drug/metabolite transporter (DMT)-like permease